MDKPLIDRNKDTKIVEKNPSDRSDPATRVKIVGRPPQKGVTIIGKSENR